MNQISTIQDDYSNRGSTSALKDLSPNSTSALFGEDEPLHLQAITLYPDEQEVERSGKRIPLRKKEYQLLEFLARNKNKIINRNTILECVWNYNVQTMTNTLEVHISNLRRKIDGDYPTKILQTIYGLGYKLCDAPGEYKPQSEYIAPQGVEAQQKETQLHEES